MNINRVELSGKLTRDAELKTTQGGTMLLRFGIAVNDRKRNPQTQEWEDVPNFFNCTMFGNYAQSIEQFLRKGRKVYIAGKLHYSEWTGQDGTKRKDVSVIVDALDFGSNGGSRQSAQQQPQAQAQGQTQQPLMDNLADEQIPF